MRKITLLFISCTLSCILLATNHNVTTVGNTFSPANITINQGDTVTWTNGGGFHNVNATQTTYPNNPEGFGNSVSSSSWTFQHIFTIPGTYDYQCDPHTAMGMVGTVIVNSVSLTPSDLTFTAIMDLTTPSAGNTGKAILLTANQTISDLSIYGFGSATNGGGSDGQEYTFPAISINAGQHIIVCRDSTVLSNYFNGCLEQFAGALYPNLIIQSSSEPTGNGNDAYELFENGLVIETFGDITHTYGSNYPSIPWGYRDSWAWKDTAAANVGNWVFGGDNCTDGSTTIQTSNCPFPLCGSAPPLVTYNVTLEVNTASIYQNGGSVGPNGMYAGGGFVGDAMGLQLTQNTTDTLKWSGVATVIAGSSPNYYTFLNSPSNGGDWGAKENLAGLPCGDPSNYNDRLLPNIFSDTTLQHCFGSCETDGSCPPPPTSFVDITFTLNVSSIIQLGGSIDSTGMFIAGGGNFGNPGDNPMTDLGNGVWSFTVNKPIGFTSDYTFTNGNSGWGAKENISGLPCAVPPYDDRNLAPVYSDTTILHCFGTCDYDGTCSSVVLSGNEFLLKGILAVDLPSSSGKAIHLYADQPINDLSIYGLGIANNGGGTDGQEYTFPNVSVNSGDHILICRDSLQLSNYLSADCFAKFSLVIEDGAVNQNGDDAVELFKNGSVLETFGDPNVDGTGEPWEYTDSWAYKDTSGNWIYGGVGCTSGFSTSDSSSCPYPLCDYSTPPTGIENNLGNIKIYPNPASNIIHIQSVVNIDEIQVLDLVGREVLIFRPNRKNFVIDVNGLNKEVYILRYTSNGKFSKSKKIIINR
ncbi:MAG: hypothetical protein CL832_01320 [Crocinitomicaceae bacterium]|nr:hypothetical protein [Crocinitomicaceae bacterium]